ncbi:TolC family outer membrane protein [soil metagenome]|tara:strand:- start:45797 stop:47119 length:1323 start_codon:yes stop_codon:yes gene_type:complete
MSPAQSLVEVFTYNPTIAGDRARAEADRIEVDIAKADGRFDFRTRIDAQHDFVNSDYRLQPRSASALTATVRVSLPLTAGGRVRTRVSGQLARASASAAQFEEVENRVLGQAVDAHLDVARDRVLLELQKEQRTVLEQLLESARFRARLGDLTRTDVDQARARLASSQAATVTAEAALTLSSAQYWALTGKQPDADMQVDDGLPRLPNMADIIALLDTAPAYKAAVFRRQEAEAAVRYARSQRYPSISAFAELGNQLAGSGWISRTGRTNATVGITLTLPLYQGGRIAAQVRAARANQAMAIEEQTGIMRDLLADVRSLYAQLRAADEAVTENRLAVAAATEARKVIIVQNSVGERSFLDILNAQSEVLQTQQRLIQARCLRISTAYRILAVLGTLDDLAASSMPLTRSPARARPTTVTQLQNIRYFPEMASWDLGRKRV